MFIKIINVNFYIKERALKTKEEQSKIFFISDLHFGSDGTLIRENRPFKNAKCFAKKVIKIWNNQASKNDFIYCIGDFVNCNDEERFEWKEALCLVQKIKAKIILVIGNNEEKLISEFFDGDFDEFRKYCLSLGFIDVVKDMHLEVEGLSLYLNHFPNNHKPDCINLFGHMHRAVGLWESYGLNMSCDLNHFQLFSIDEIKRVLELKAKWWKSHDSVCWVKDLLTYVK